MKVNSITQNNVNFKAKLINPAKIKVKVNYNKWVDDDCNFVKFNTSNEEDIQTINNIRKLWKNKNLSDSIAEELDIMGNKAEIFALTRQKDNFENMDAKMVLGLMTTDKINQLNRSINIYKIGSSPEFAYAQHIRHRSLKYTGKTLLQEFVKYIKGQKNIESIRIEAEPTDIDFLNRINFPKRVEDVFILNRENFDEFIK